VRGFPFFPPSLRRLFGNGVGGNGAGEGTALSCPGLFSGERVLNEHGDLSSRGKSGMMEENRRTFGECRRRTASGLLFSGIFLMILSPVVLMTLLKKAKISPPSARRTLRMEEF